MGGGESLRGGGGGASHRYQREWKGDQSSLKEFKGGTKENWRLMRKIDRIIRNVMEGSGKFYGDNILILRPLIPPTHLH